VRVPASDFGGPRTRLWLTLTTARSTRIVAWLPALLIVTSQRRRAHSSPNRKPHHAASSTMTRCCGGIRSARSLICAGVNNSIWVGVGFALAPWISTGLRSTRPSLTAVAMIERNSA